MTLRRIALFLLAVIVSVSANSPAWASKQPKLILQITVDALRGDLPTRFPNMLGQGGFTYLLEEDRKSVV